MSVLGKRLLAVVVGAVIVWGAWAYFASNFLGCTAAGCFSSLTIETGVIPVDGTTYEIEVCLDGECWSGTQTGNEYLPGADGSIRLDADGVVDVGLPVEEERHSTGEMSIIITADGDEIVRHQDGGVRVVSAERALVRAHLLHRHGRHLARLKKRRSHARHRRCLRPRKRDVTAPL